MKNHHTYIYTVNLGLPGSNFGQLYRQVYRDFPQSFQVNTGKEPQLGHDSFLTHPSYFIIH